MEKQRLVSVRLYVHREHSDYLAKAVNRLGAAVKYDSVSPLQALISVRIRTRLDRFQEVLGTLVSNRVPYDAYADSTGNHGHARFTSEHQYVTVANTKGTKPTVYLDWDNQARLRKEWATMKLINMISE